MKKLVGAALGAILVLGSLAAPSLASRKTRSDALGLQKRLGYLPIDLRTYSLEKVAAAQAVALKAAARSVAGSRRALPVPVPRIRRQTPSWQGVSDPNFTPPDTTGAIGPTRYVQMVNDQVGVFTRRGGLVAAAPLSVLTGHNQADLTDPQILWDPNTQRFYYEVLDDAHDTLAWGFSMSDSPSAIPGDFCNYTADFGYGSDLPDYPKLGTTSDFLLIGSNVFNTGGKYIGSDVAWIAKPQGSAPLLSCPPQATFALGKTGVTMTTPVPAVQTDPSSTGWVVGNYNSTHLAVYSVTKDPTTGAATIASHGLVTINSWSVPPQAPELGSSYTLDTMDGRLRQAVSGFDPTNSATAVWTAQCIAGGAGAKERWYEIDPSALSMLQSGSVSDPSLYVFNGAIAPNRAVMPTGSAGGNSMVMGFNTSSAVSYPDIEMVSKVPGSPLASPRVETTSDGPNVDFSCTTQLGCRWGDYSGASPDPTDSYRVWLTNQWDVAGATSSDVDWRTWIWRVHPFS